jgi:hypothetical protein
MYGTTIKSYNTSKGSKPRDGGFFSRNKNVRKKSSREDGLKTRYLKINEREYDSYSETSSTATYSTKSAEQTVSRKEFPIASVVLTVIITMISLLIGTGVIGL